MQAAIINKSLYGQCPVVDESESLGDMIAPDLGDELVANSTTNPLFDREEDDHSNVSVNPAVNPNPKQTTIQLPAPTPTSHPNPNPSFAPPRSNMSHS